VLCMTWRTSSALSLTIGRVQIPQNMVRRPHDKTSLMYVIKCLCANVNDLITCYFGVCWQHNRAQASLVCVTTCLCVMCGRLQYHELILMYAG